ncbi:MAG TPA: tetratricopeptide repeat protein [Planctomycetota bacterium]|nr:tetratricopeptide repeat protein [Planctomycetota bacterium]
MHTHLLGSGVDPLNRALIALHRDRRFRSVAFPLRSEQLDQARELYARAGSEEAMIMIARLDVEQGRYDAAIAALEPLLSRRPDDRELPVLLGAAYRRARRYDDALEMYRRALAGGPNARVEYNRGIALSRMGRTGEAIAAYERALDLAPSFAPAMANLGQAWLERGRTPEAIALLRRALEADPDALTARATLGFAHFLSGDIDAAQRITNEVLERAPDSAAALNTLGKIQEARCGAAACPPAVAAYERAIALDRAYAEPRLNLAQLRLDAGDSAAAASLARQALEIRPAWTAARVVLARAMQREERWNDAMEELARAVRDDGGDARARAELAHVHLMMGNAAAAAAEARRAIALHPGHAAAYVTLGHAHLSLGEMPAALAAYERALETGPPAGVVHNNLAVIHFRLGRHEEARRHAIAAQALGTSPHPGLVAALEQAHPRHLIYLHGRIIQDQQDRRALHPEHGHYELEKIAEAFREQGFVVTAEVRPKGTSVDEAAARVVEQVRRLLESGVPANRIVVAGASMGASIAFEAAARLQNRDVRFAVLGACLSANLRALHREGKRPSGRLIAIREETDEMSTPCKPWDDSETPSSLRTSEVVVHTGLGHGFFYRPLPDWVEPMLEWAGNR